MFGNPIDVAGDCEVFPNFWSCAIVPIAPDDHTVWIYEISPRRNDGPWFVAAMRSRYFRRMYGFNNLNFDGPLIQEVIKLVDQGATTPAHAPHMNIRLKALAQEIIGSGSRWSHRVNWKDEVVKQVDLYLMHHFDNPARSTSLKTLEFNMRARRVQDLPFPHDTVLEPWQMDVVRDYNVNDSRETKAFVHKSQAMIDFRDKLGGDRYLNMNDTAIGKAFFVKTLEERFPGSCYGADRKPRQTWRATVPLGDVIFPWIGFERPEARLVLDRLKSTVLRADEIKATEGIAKVETKGVFKDLHATIDGFRLDFGTGGLHGSVTNRIVKADATYEIADIDVTAYYPSIAIVNNVYPEHLGPGFVQVYRELKEQRVAAKRAGDMVKSDALKLANNGVYGDSNNVYGPFYDPKYTMTITVNGQLMLVMAAEQFLKIPGLEIIQVNTDGMTLRFPRSQRAAFDYVCNWWQRGTGMDLEENQYEAMWIRDVNNYIARDLKGKYKRKGAYDFELKVGDQKAWHKNHSSLVIQKAASAALCDDLDPADFIRNHNDPWDFLIREKVTGSSRLVLADGTPCQSTTRYYVAHDGQAMFKIMPPLKGKTDDRRMSVHAEGQAFPYGPKGDFRCSICGDHGPSFKFKHQFETHNSEHHTFKVRVCNVYEGGPLTSLNYDYYLKEAEKLILQ